ncbi:MAG TPA: hypothetical protein VFU69_07070 [Ktedonobacterales bacterium]|nr:hypothetical protein [Ktedonobacterales bacterium]
MSPSRTADFTLRYQRVPGAQYHVRPLSLLQQDVLYRCDGNVTVADLADATRYTHPEIRGVLHFLAAHGLVKTLLPEPWLFTAFAPASAWHRAPAEQPFAGTRARPWRLVER